MEDGGENGFNACLHLTVTMKWQDSIWHRYDKGCFNATGIDGFLSTKLYGGDYR